MMKSLAIVCLVEQIITIKDSPFDFIKVGGWYSLTPKNTLKVGEKGVFFNRDSFLPSFDKRFNFLDKFFFYWDGYLGFHVKPVQYRNFISQGLFLPVKKFPELLDCAVGFNATNILKIKLYDPDDFIFYKGQTVSCDIDTDFHDVEYLQNLSGHFKTEIISRTFEKVLDVKGIKMFILFDGISLKVFDKNKEYLDRESCTFWKVVNQSNVEELLKSYGQNILLSGYLSGPDILDNPLCLTKNSFVLSDIYDIDLNRFFYVHERDIFLRAMQTISTNIELLPHKGFHTFTNGITIEDVIVDSHKLLASNPNNNAVIYRRIDGEFSFKVTSDFV